METIKIGNQTYEVMEFDYNYDDDAAGGDVAGTPKGNPMIELLDKFNKDYPKMVDALSDFHNMVTYIDQMRYCAFALTALAFIGIIMFLTITYYYRRKNCEQWIKNAVMAREWELCHSKVAQKPTEKLPLIDGYQHQPNSSRLVKTIVQASPGGPVRHILRSPDDSTIIQLNATPDKSTTALGSPRIGKRARRTHLGGRWDAGGQDSPTSHRWKEESVKDDECAHQSNESDISTPEELSHQS